MIKKIIDDYQGLLFLIFCQAALICALAWTFYKIDARIDALEAKFQHKE